MDSFINFEGDVQVSYDADYHHNVVTLTDVHHSRLLAGSHTTAVPLDSRTTRKFEQTMGLIIIVTLTPQFSIKDFFLFFHVSA